jgi:feruloyl esterase
MHYFSRLRRRTGNTPARNGHHGRFQALQSSLGAVAATGLVLGATAAPGFAVEPVRTGLPAVVASSTVQGPSAALQAECTDLVDFDFADTEIVSAAVVPTGTLSHRGEPVAEHCLVTGTMNERVSEVDDQTYAIGFEMRLPDDWNGRYLYQGNGGLDGAIATAFGRAGGSDSGLQLGMAVISSDAGHTGSQNPTFGLDPQARLDYGYQAVGTLTPMAKALIEEAYGTAPHHSYIAGSSNGGRHTMVAASRYTDEYDGFLAVAPGFNLPQAAVAQLWGAQQWNTVATSEDLNSALTVEERQVAAEAILAQCDDLDGLDDGLVQASDECQKVFSAVEHVPTCDAERDGTCLSEEQQAVVEEVFAGATTSEGQDIYSSFPYDPGLVQTGWADWKFNAPISRDSVAVGYIFSTPPYAPALNALRDFVLALDIDEANERIHATSDLYAESAMEFMTPTDLGFEDLAESGGKMLVIHGASDGVFSMDDTTAWYRGLEEHHGGDASDFVQYFQVPGMGHTSGGPSTDQHDSLAALVDWVEDGNRPDRLDAWVNQENTQLPEDWADDRSRPLCAYPTVAVYAGGDPESAASFDCASVPADFTDSQPGSAFYAPVHWMAAQGISVGYADGTFKKNRKVTRAETTAFLHRYMDPDFTAPAKSRFADINPGGAFFTPITWAATEGITAGYADGTFKPSKAVTRAEFAAFLYRLAEPTYTVPKASPFKDVNAGGAHYAAITWLSSEGITVGTTRGEFNPTSPITRGQISAFLHRYDRAVGKG